MSGLEIEAAYSDGSKKNIYAGDRALSCISHSSSNSSYGTVSGGGMFKKGEPVTIEALPGEGCQFDAWSDGSTQPHRAITVEANVSLTAYFYGPISNWSERVPSNAVVVDEETQYRCRDLKTTSSTTQSSMSVWWRSSGDDKYSYEYQTRERITRYYFQQYGTWSGWSFNTCQESSTRKVETRSVYQYRLR